jgi:hypothetical protein
MARRAYIQPFLAEEKGPAEMVLAMMQLPKEQQTAMWQEFSIKHERLLSVHIDEVRNIVNECKGLAAGVGAKGICGVDYDEHQNANEIEVVCGWLSPGEGKSRGMAMTRDPLTGKEGDMEEQEISNGHLDLLVRIGSVKYRLECLVCKGRPDLCPRTIGFRRFMQGLKEKEKGNGYYAPSQRARQEASVPFD